MLRTLWPFFSFIFFFTPCKAFTHNQLPADRLLDTKSIELTDLEDEISRITELDSPWEIPHSVFFPALLFGHSKSPRLVNLKATDLNSFIKSGPKDPMALIANRRWNLGSGVKLKAPIYPLPLIQLAALGVRSKSYTLIKKFNSTTEALQHKDFMQRIRFHTSDVHNLRQGEKLSYVAQGAFLMRAQVKVGPILSLGPMVAFESTSSVRITVHTDHILEISMLFDTTKRLSAEARTPVYERSIAKFSSNMHKLIFTLNPQQIASKKILNDILRGDLRSAQEYSLFTPQLSQNLVLTQQGTRKHERYGIPFIAYKKNNNIQKLIKYSETDHAYQTSAYTETDGKLKVYSKKYQSVYARVKKLEKKKRLSVYTSVDTLYEKDQLSSEEFSTQLKRLESLFQIKLPHPEKDFENKSYSQLQVTLRLGPKIIEKLLVPNQLQKLHDTALEQLKTDFRLTGHRAFCRFYDYYKCIAGFKNYINNRARELKELQKMIQNSLDTDNTKSTSRYISTFIKVLFSSDYLTSAFMELDFSKTARLSFNYTGKDYRALRCLFKATTQEFTCQKRQFILSEL